MRHRRNELDAPAVEYLREDGGWIYAVELADALGTTVSHARSVLRRMRNAGLFESRLEPSTRSGHGRCYFRWKGGAA